MLPHPISHHRHVCRWKGPPAPPDGVWVERMKVHLCRTSAERIASALVCVVPPPPPRRARDGAIGPRPPLPPALGTGAHKAPWRMAGPKGDPRGACGPDPPPPRPPGLGLGGGGGLTPAEGPSRRADTTSGAEQWMCLGPPQRSCPWPPSPNAPPAPQDLPPSGPSTAPPPPPPGGLWGRWSVGEASAPCPRGGGGGLCRAMASSVPSVHGLCL